MPSHQWQRDNIQAEEKLVEFWSFKSKYVQYCNNQTEK